MVSAPKVFLFGLVLRISSAFVHQQPCSKSLKLEVQALRSLVPPVTIRRNTNNNVKDNNNDIVNRMTMLPAYSSCRSHSMSTTPDEGAQSNSPVTNLRSQLRKMTGFSLTAFRTTLRAFTGVSLSALYVSALAASGLYVRRVMSFVLSIFPAWFRYFLQPFLIMYYAPLLILRGLLGPTRKRARERHDSIMENWREAVECAKEAEKDGYWPVRVTEEGYFEAVAPPSPEKLSLADAVADSIEAASEQKRIAEEQSEMDGNYKP